MNVRARRTSRCSCRTTRPTTSSTDLRALGYDNIIYTQAGVPLEFGDLRAHGHTRFARPSDGPIGDSSLSVDDGTARILNQNDSHPLDLEKLLGFSKPEAYFTQVSGAIWWPMVYDLPQEAKQNFARLKREAQNKRAMYYVEKVDAAARLPDGRAADVPARRAVPLQRVGPGRRSRSSPTSASSSRTWQSSARRSRATCSSRAPSWS